MNWKESNLFIAVSSCVATTLFLITIFFTVIIPTWNESYKNEIKELRSAIPKYPQILRDLKDKEATILDLKAQLKAMRLENIFAGNTPYPAGYREIVIGNPLSKVKQVYPEDSVEEIEGILGGKSLRVKIEHALFSNIYYGSVKEAKGKITSIFFYFNDPYEPLPYETLKKKLAEVFPSKQYSEAMRNKKRVLSISNIDGLDIELTEVGMTIW